MQGFWRRVLDALDVAGCIMLLVTLALIAVACGREKDPKESVPEVTPTQDDRDLYRETEAHALDHVFGGFGIVSWGPGRDPVHEGEAGIWGGTFLWAASCEGGRAVSEALARTIESLDGQVVRVEPLGEYANGRQATLDTFLGIAAGVARRVVDCGEAALWAHAWFELVEFQATHGDRLHAGTANKVPGEFRYVRDLIAWKLGLRDRPSDGRKFEFQQTAAAWPGLVLLAHRTGLGSDACFRVNLSWTSIVTTETLGDELGSSFRETFCGDTVSMGIPQVDHYCGREPIASYLDGYEVDAWEHRLQRCAPPWESADGDGNTSPRVDRLVALVVKHGWQALQ